MCGNFCGGHKFWIKHSWKTQNFKYLAGLGLRKKYCFTKKIHIRRKAQVQLQCDDVFQILWFKEQQDTSFSWTLA